MGWLASHDGDPRRLSRWAAYHATRIRDIALGHADFTRRDLRLRALQSFDALPRRLRSPRGDADLYAACRRRRTHAVCAFHLAMAARTWLVDAARLAGLLGRPWALAADPCPSACASVGTRAVHLSRVDLDVGCRISRLRPGADGLDSVWRGRGDPLGPLPLCTGAQGAGCQDHRSGFRHRHAVGLVPNRRWHVIPASG